MTFGISFTDEGVASGFFRTSAKDLPPPQVDTAFTAETAFSESGVDERLDFSSVLQSSVDTPVEIVDADLVEFPLPLCFGTDSALFPNFD